MYVLQGYVIVIDSCTFVSAVSEALVLILFFCKLWSLKNSPNLISVYRNARRKTHSAWTRHLFNDSTLTTAVVWYCQGRQWSFLSSSSLQMPGYSRNNGSLRPAPSSVVGRCCWWRYAALRLRRTNTRPRDKTLRYVLLLCAFLSLCIFATLLLICGERKTMLKYTCLFSRSESR